VPGLFLVLILCGALLGSVPTVALPAPDVQIVTQDGGGYLVTTPVYRARIGVDGNLHAISVNGQDFLDDKVPGSAGGSFFVDRPVTLPAMTLQESTLAATDGTYAILYEFFEGYLTVTLRQSSAKGAAYAVIGAAPVSYVENLEAGTLAATPAEHDWGDVRFALPTGEYLELRGGSRIWGRGINRQVWERSNLAPNKDYSLMLIPGQGKPRQPELAQLTTLALTVNGQDNLIPGGTPVELTGRFTNNSRQPINSEVLVRVETSLGTTILENRKPFTCAPHDTTTLTWTLQPPAPDFYSVASAITLNATTNRTSTTFGYDVDAIAPPSQAPHDFATYWAQVTAEARALPVKLTRLEDPSRSTSTVSVARVGFESEGATIFGWLCVPKFPGRYPGILLLPGERVRYITPNAALADCGFVVLTVEPTGQPVDGAIKPLWPRASANLLSPATVGMRALTVRYLRALSALATLPEVDAHRLAVSGIALGGGMALVLGALDERIQAVAADVPFFCHVDYGRQTTTWPYRTLEVFHTGAPEQQEAALTTLRYFDVANFVERVTCPVLISAGIHDTYSRPTAIYGIANRLAGPHAIKLYPAGHEGGGTKHWQEKIRWLSEVLGSPSPLPPPPTVPAAGEGPTP
jgi:cephalosporin-C deacetylase